MPVDFFGLILGFIVWLGGTVTVYYLAKHVLSFPPPHGVVHPRVPQVVAYIWTGLASLLLVPIGLVVVWFYELAHGRS